jgi:DNA polymerase bacteriophage-type
LKRRMLYIDFETSSEAELAGSNSVGLYNYATHPSTRALMLAWAINNGDVQLWFCSEDEMPERLREALLDPDTDIVAFNSSFERYILRFVIGVTLSASRFQDPQPSARYLSLPGYLSDVSMILGLPVDLAKDKEGKRLIGIFCKPTKRKKKKGEPESYYFRDESTDPEDWVKFCDYCKQDVVAEREVLRRLGLLGAWPLPPKERSIWIFDQGVNDIGIPVDLGFVQKAYRLACKAKQTAIDTQNRLTGLENANSNTQMQGWANDHGYKPTSLAKEHIAAALKYDNDMDEVCKEVLRNRKAAASTSYKKMETLMRQIGPDERVRNLFTYMGSARCGRWSSNALQFHNMARPEERFESEEYVAWARAIIHAEDYDALESWFGDPEKVKNGGDPGAVLLTIKSLIRTVFVTKGDNEFAVADENAIETRVAAWVANCPALLDVFHKGRDPYLDFAVKMTQIVYEKLAADIKSKDPLIKAAAKRHRQVAKPGVLGCVYRMSGGEIVMRDGVPVKTGLWGYSENMGVEMDQETAHEVVRIFRESYKEIVEFWYLIEKLVAEVLNSSGKVVRTCGPNGCIKIDKVTIEERDPLLRIQLPSGRYLHYMDASIQPTKMLWKQRDEEGNQTVDVYKPSLVYSGQDQKTHQWAVVTSHGGKLFENIVQGIARDVLAHVMLIIQNERGMIAVGHVHDECIVEKSTDPFAPGLLEMEWIMSQSIPWAEGLPLKADGFQSQIYHK